MRVFYSDHHTVPLPPGHRFPMGKYALLRRALLADGVLDPAQFHPAEPLPGAHSTDPTDPTGPTDDRGDALDGVWRLARVHDPAYVDAVLAGALSPRELRALGFPWSDALVRRTLASIHGTLLAARAALTDGLSGNLAGGTHHAHRDRGSGFCVFNDIAVAARALLDDGLASQVLVIDADVHQGDGTAAIMADDPRVFTFSIHGAKNFPFHKATSDLDVALPDGTGDAEYLAALERGLATCTDRLPGRPDIAFYQAGVDPLAEDKLGRLALTAAGLRARDALVLNAARARDIPVAITLGGGYADPLAPTIAAHVGTYRAATDVFGDPSRASAAVAGTAESVRTSS